MAIKNCKKMWVLALAALTIPALVFIVSISYSDGENATNAFKKNATNIFKEDDVISRDALYQASTTIFAVSAFSSVLAYGFRGGPDSKKYMIDAASLLFAGAVFVSLFQALLMLSACCADKVEPSWISFLVSATFCAMLLFGVGAALLIKAFLVGLPGRRRANTP